MNILELVKKNRTYRRFDNSRQISQGLLSDMIDAARLSQSGANAQPLRYVTISEPDKCSEIYPHLRWAGRLKDWDGPVKEERPTAYIIVASDTEAPKTATPAVDSGLAMQNMLLHAISQGVGSCIFGNFIKKEIREILSIDERYDLLWVIALGYPVENVILEDYDGDLGYHRDSEANHYVPKYKQDEIILDKF